MCAWQRQVLQNTIIARFTKESVAVRPIVLVSYFQIPTIYVDRVREMGHFIMTVSVITYALRSIVNKESP